MTPLSPRRGAALATLVATLAAVAVAPAAPAAAAPAAGTPAGSGARPPGPGWLPYRTPAFSEPAGDPCAFPVDATVVRDQEWYRVISSYPDGSPRLEQFTGPLVIRYTNRTTGASAVRDLSGTAWFAFGRDGSLVVPWSGGGGITSHPGNVGLAPGEWVFTGNFVLVEDAGRNKSVVQVTGTRENLCTTLG